MSLYYERPRRENDLLPPHSGNEWVKRCTGSPRSGRTPETCPIPGALPRAASAPVYSPRPQHSESMTASDGQCILQMEKLELFPRAVRQSITKVLHCLKQEFLLKQFAWTSSTHWHKFTSSEKKCDWISVTSITKPDASCWTPAIIFVNFTPGMSGPLF